MSKRLEMNNRMTEDLFQRSFKSDCPITSREDYLVMHAAYTNIFTSNKRKPEEHRHQPNSATATRSPFSRNYFCIHGTFLHLRKGAYGCNFYVPSVDVSEKA